MRLKNRMHKNKVGRQADGISRLPTQIWDLQAKALAESLADIVKNQAVELLEQS